MSYHSDLDLHLAAVREAMAEPHLSDQPETVQLEYRMDSILREMRSLPVRKLISVIVGGLDELCAMANDEQAAPVLANELYGLGQIKSRTDLALSSLNARGLLGPRLVRGWS